jgi:hypothetical protein
MLQHLIMKPSDSESPFARFHWKSPGLKNCTRKPFATSPHRLPTTSTVLKTIPKTPRAQLMFHIAEPLPGFLMTTHMKHGYARVTGSEMPPRRPASSDRNGSATAMRKLTAPKKTRKPERSHHGHGRSFLCTYPASMLSYTGMAYIWYEVRQLMITSRVVIPRTTWDTSRPWNLYRARSMPLGGICE